MDSPVLLAHLRPATEAVVERFGGLMRVLHAARGARRSPWDDCPLTVQQLRALSLLAGSERGLIGRELAARLGVGPSAITPLVDRLVEHGFVDRREVPTDRRASHLVASDAGVALLGRMSAGHADLLRDILAHLNPQQMTTVGDALDLLVDGARTVLLEDAARASRGPRPL